jgi:tetratricopeptide (TPR) repeat protein
LDRVLEVQSQSATGDPLKQAAMRALYLGRRMGAGKWDPGDLEECRNVLAQLREAGDRHLLGEIQLGLGYTLLLNFSEYREAHRSAVEGFAILLEDYEENPYLSFNFKMYADLVSQCSLFLGEWGEALRQLEHLIEMVGKNGDRLSATIAGLQRARLHIEAMDFAGAQRVVESALPIVAAIPQIYRFGLIVAGSAEAGLGNHRRALDYLISCRDQMDAHAMTNDWHNRMPLHQALTEVWLSQGELEKARVEAGEFLKVTLATEERTFRALAFEANARVAIAEGDLVRAKDWITKALQSSEGFEIPLAHWRVHATAFELYQQSGDRIVAQRHLTLSRDMIMKLANSLPAEEPLRKTFLSAPMVRRVLGERIDEGQTQVDPGASSIGHDRSQKPTGSVKDIE